jgi:ferredoxin
VAVFIDAEECIGCSACVPTCPHDAIQMSDTDVIAVLDTELCEDCNDCIEMCPVDAILVEGAERPAPREAAPATPPPAREESQPRWERSVDPSRLDRTHACEDEPFSLLSWRPGEGKLRRKLRNRLRGR